MAVLTLPLSINTTGILATPRYEHELLLSRVRFFVLSGIGKYTDLPSPGMGTLWTYLYTIGGTSRLCLQSVLPEREREELQRTILDEINLWLDQAGIPFVISVRIIGDETVENGIVFRTSDTEVRVQFEFALQGKNLRPDAVGSWNINIESYAIH